MNFLKQPLIVFSIRVAKNELYCWICNSNQFAYVLLRQLHYYIVATQPFLKATTTKISIVTTTIHICPWVNLFRSRKINMNYELFLSIIENYETTYKFLQPVTTIRKDPFSSEKKIMKCPYWFLLFLCSRSNMHLFSFMATHLILLAV